MVEVKKKNLQYVNKNLHLRKLDQPVEFWWSSYDEINSSKTRENNKLKVLCRSAHNSKRWTGGWAYQILSIKALSYGYLDLYLLNTNHSGVFQLRNKIFWINQFAPKESVGGLRPPPEPLLKTFWVASQRVNSSSAVYFLLLQRRILIEIASSSFKLGKILANCII